MKSRVCHQIGVLALTGAAILSIPTTAAAQGPGAWSGFYVGAHAGWAGSRTTADGVDGDLTMRGGMGGGHLGYNHQINTMVVGLELDASALGASKSETDAISTVKARQDYLASARLRLGLAATPGLLLYATGGLGHSRLRITDTGPGFSDTLSASKAGWVLGGGAEYKFTSTLSARAEVLHYLFSDMPLKFQGVEVGKFDNSTTVVRAGLTLHLN